MSCPCMPQDSLAAHNEMLEKFLAAQQVGHHHDKAWILAWVEVRVRTGSRGPSLLRIHGESVTQVPP